MTTPSSNHRITRADLEAVLRPIADARGMPNATYEDPALFQYERDQVIGRRWAAIAFTSELPREGFAKPINFMGLPLAIMRNREGEVNVFHNVCSHRGMILVREETEVRNVLRCPYHCWNYDLNGNLKATPNIAGMGQHTVAGFDRSRHGLKKVRSASWLGMIFINLSGDAEDFATFIEPLVSRWEAFVGVGGLNQVRVAHTHSEMELTVQANWKLAVENYCESYHLPAVHPALNRYSPLSKHYNLVVNDHMSGQGTLNYNLAEMAGFSLPQFEHWPSDKQRHAEYVSLYPNVLLGIQADHVFAVMLQPLSHEQTLEKLQ
ncbi:aromatic ring-hydroxylating dioxygenase subunit alpha, partial [Aquisalimonas sp.]|uniref:aromatic ring-hydroxylating oxygenase subunit alpha n=1 Tax=Aquisalimonas sp. TaxID=1872621 RepID=UPI0025BE3898